MGQMFRDSLKRLELPGEGCDNGAPSGAAPQQHLVTPRAAAPEQERSDNSSSSGNSTQQQQKQHVKLVQSPDSQQTHLVPLLHKLGQTAAGAATLHKAQQQPAPPFNEQTEPSETPGHCALAARAGAGGDLRGDPVMKSNYRGLTWDKKDGRWRVRIQFMGKQHHIGRFADEDEAAQHFDSAAYYLFGDRAITNFGVAAAASSNIPISSNIRALLHTSISSVDEAKSAAAVPGRGGDLVAAAAAAAAGPATVSQPVQPPMPHHSSQRQLQRQLQLPLQSIGVMPQRNVDGSGSQQQQQHAMQSQRHSQFHDAMNTLTVRHNQFKTSCASSPQQEQQQQRQAIGRPELLLPSGLTAAAARPTPAWSLALQTRSNQQPQHQQHDVDDGMLGRPLVDKPHWPVNRLHQTLNSHNTNIRLSRQDRLGLHQQPVSAAMSGVPLHTTADPCEVALDLTALATAAAAEQAAEQRQQWQPKQQQQLAEPCLVPMVVDTAAAGAGAAAAGGGGVMDQSEAVTAMLVQLIQYLSPELTNGPAPDTQPPRQDTVSEVHHNFSNLQRHPAGAPTVAARRTAIHASVCHSLNGAPAAVVTSRDGPGMASHAELVLQSAVTAAGAAAGKGGGGGERVVLGSSSNAQLVEDRLCSGLMQLHHQHQQLHHYDHSTTAGQSQLMQLKRDKLRLLMEWQQHLQGQFQQSEQEQHQALQLIAPVAGNKLMQLTSTHQGDSSSAGVAASTTVPVVAAACASPVVSAVATGTVVHSEPCVQGLLAALECLVKPGTSSSGQNSKTIAGRKRNTSDNAHLPSTMSALQHSGGGHGSSNSRDRWDRVQTPPGTASLNEADLLQQLLSNMQRSRTLHAAPHTCAAAAIAAANAAVAAAAAPEGPAACVEQWALQPAPSNKTDYDSGGGPAGPEAKRQRRLSSSADIMAQLLAVAGNTARPSTSSGMRTWSDVAAPLGLNELATDG